MIRDIAPMTRGVSSVISVYTLWHSRKTEFLNYIILFRAAARRKSDAGTLYQSARSEVVEMRPNRFFSHNCEALCTEPRTRRNMNQNLGCGQGVHYE